MPSKCAGLKVGNARILPPVFWGEVLMLGVNLNCFKVALRRTANLELFLGNERLDKQYHRKELNEREEK